MRPVKRPAHEPLLSINRKSDGALVEMWATKHAWRSQDRMLDGTTYYRPLVFIGGALYDHMPRRYSTPEDAAGAVRRMLAPNALSDS